MNKPCMSNQNSKQSALAGRLVEMGLTPITPVFPPDGVPLVQLVPWWRLWPRDPQHNFLTHPGAAMFPVIAEGIASLQQGNSAPQAVFAALLPIHQPDSAITQWINYTIAAAGDRAFGGPAAGATVLESLLEGRPDEERAGAWRQVLEGTFDFKGRFRYGDSGQAGGLLECVGRSGLQGLARFICPILQNEDQEIVLAAIACLARLGVPNAEFPSEFLLTRLCAETVDVGRTALAFVESGDIDRLDGLLATEGWLERVQALRLAEALLNCDPMVERLGEGWLHRLIELLLTRLQSDQDRDVVRCLATTLGLVLKRCSEPPLERLIHTASQLTDEARSESLLNAMLIAGLPNSAAMRVEALRGHSLALGRNATRALNRVMMAFGEPCGCVFDWMESNILALRQTGVIRLPDGVKDWFDAPERCPEAQVASWLRDPGDSDMASMFCAAYLNKRPAFLKVLEHLWIEAAYSNDGDLMKRTGGLLAGAAEDCRVAPAELRCCLGHEVGGPLPESPENVGRLLGLLLTQDGDVRESAEELLLQMPSEHRIVVAGALRWLPRNRNPFEYENDRPRPFHDIDAARASGARPSRFGAGPSALDHSIMFPIELQPLFSTCSTEGFPPRVTLETMAFGGGRKGGRAAKSLEWDNPEAVRAAFLEIDSTELASVFLRISSSPHSDLRRNAIRLAVGVGARLLQTSFRERIVQRLVALAQDSDKEIKAAVALAAQSLGIADRVPVAPPSGSTGNVSTPPAPEFADDPMLEELLAELGSPLI
jgi:hypothetical protein